MWAQQICLVFIENKNIIMDTLELTKEKKTKAATENISGSEAVLRAFVAEGVETNFSDHWRRVGKKCCIDHRRPF